MTSELSLSPRDTAWYAICYFSPFFFPHFFPFPIFSLPANLGGWRALQGGWERAEGGRGQCQKPGTTPGASLVPW